MSTGDDRMKAAAVRSSSASNSLAAGVNNNHDASRVYRGVIETAKKLEAITLNANTLGHLFTSEADQLRSRLKEQCQVIFLSAPVEFGRRVEEPLWRRCYHDAMQFYKRWKNKMTVEDRALLEVHFTAGLGHYNNLILSISKHYLIKLDSIFPYVILPKDWWSDPLQEPAAGDEVLDWAHQAIYRMLIYMGDLTRYLNDLGQTVCKDIAIRFYEAALIWEPDLGMPFNQIGTLSDGENYGVDSIYYYMRCLNSVKPFEGADSNICRIFQNNKKFVKEFEEQLITTNDESFAVVKKAFCQFINVCQEFWSRKNWNDDEGRVNGLIQEVLYSFKAAFDLKPKMTTSQMPTFLGPMQIFEIAILSILLIDRLEQNEIDPKNKNTPQGAFATFAFNFILYAIQSCHKNLQQKLGIEDSKPNGLNNFSPGMSKENTPELSPRRALSRMRRRKAAVNYDDGNMLSLDNDDDSDLSELEETALSTIDALEIGSDIESDSENEDGNQLDDTLVSSDEGSLKAASNKQPSDGKNDTSSTSSCSTTTTTRLPAEDLLNYVVNESSIPTIKSFCDWISINKRWIVFAGNFVRGYFEEFIAFCNSLIEIQEKVLLTFPNLNEFKCSGPNWNQVYPLPTDMKLSNLKQLKEAFRDRVDFAVNRDLTCSEKGFLYLQSILSFCHDLTRFNFKNNDIDSLVYSTDQKRFKLNLCTNGMHLNFDHNTWTSDVNTCFVESNVSWPPFPSILPQHNNQLANNDFFGNNANQDNMKKQGRTLAHLWLKAEVNKLEKDVRGGGVPQLPPYLVLDSSACDYLEIVKQLVASKRFIIVVPKIVFEALDQQKKFSSQAREASRWLETEVERGNRMIRLQKEYEKLTLLPIKYPKKKDKDACDFFDILECCNYLNKNHLNKSSATDNDLNISMVTLLTAANNKWPANAEIVASSTGIKVETIDSFVAKWQNANSKPAKAKT